MKQLVVYQRLLEIIHSSQKGGFTFKMVRERMRTVFEIQGLDPTYSLRTFQRDLNEIRDVHGIDIQFNKRLKLYEVIQELSSPIRTKVLESFEIIYTLNLQRGLESIVFFDASKAKGTEHLNTIIYAIKNRFLLRFQHNHAWKYNKVREIKPLALKEFKNTWYLIGLNENDQLRNYGLDRIHELQILPTKFDSPDAIDIRSYYQDAYGILNDDAEKVEEIILSFTPEKGNYIRSKPIHLSQRILIDDKDQLKISLNLKINKDFIAEVLSFGDTVVIEKPERLKVEITKIIKKMLKYM